ncbi:MAG TPA: pentapeptide repeat-containing protein, partial [Thermoclostridium sp.]|nr:pentapeptide repeat-containing protein [Thermoclostridium sp.]
MDKKPFNRDEALTLLKNGYKKALLDYDLTGADLTGANLTEANLRGANLTEAGLTGANLDFSCYPLWCGGLKVKTDKRIACQLAYHLCSMQCDDPEYVK